MTDLYPKIKTTIKDEGTVIFHDITPYRLCRMCVASYGRYPTLETWLDMLPKDANSLLHRYTEKITAESVFIGYLWIYYKQGR